MCYVEFPELYLLILLYELWISILFVLRCEEHFANLTENKKVLDFL